MSGDDRFDDLPAKLKEKYDEYMSRVENVRKNMDSTHLGMELLKLHPFRVEFETSFKMFLEDQRQKAEVAQAKLIDKQLDAIKGQINAFENQSQSAKVLAESAKIQKVISLWQTIAVAIIAIFIGAELYLIYQSHDIAQNNSALVETLGKQLAAARTDSVQSSAEALKAANQTVSMQTALATEQKRQNTIAAEVALINAVLSLRRDNENNREKEKYYEKKLDELVKTLDKHYQEASGTIAEHR